MTTHTYQQRDRLLQKEAAFPAAGATVKTDAFDLGPITHLGYRNRNMEFEFSSPELTKTELPPGMTLKFSLEFSDDPDFTKGVAVFYCNEWVQTGTNAGTEGIVRRFRVSTDSKRYARLTCKNVGGTLSGKTFLFELLT